MAIITRLEARGFKSFARGVDIPFTDGFNCIMGPNGSGKSNIADAIIFVLGESSARNMRAGKSASLIYNGGKKGTPAKEAEVSIYFDNSGKEFPIDAREVAITRSVKHSGNSVYKINNEVHTRQQVVDLLSSAKIDADGHNIVMQGDISQFTAMRPEDRRHIVEDLSGISVYEDKKQKALSDLGKVQEQLDQANIILIEREKFLHELKKDRDQASEFRKLEENLSRNKATRLNTLITDKTARHQEVESKYADVKKEVEHLQGKINLAKAEIDQKKQELQAISSELSEKGDLKQRMLQREIEVIKTDSIKKSIRKDVVESEIKKVNERKRELTKTVKDQEDNLLKLRKERERLGEANKKQTERIDEIQNKVDAFKAKHGLQSVDDANSRIISIDGQIEDKQRFLQTILETKQEHVREKDKADFEIQALEEKLGKGSDSEVIAKLKLLKEDFKAVTRKLSDSLNENSVFAAQLSAARKRSYELNDELSQLRMRTASAREGTSADRAIQKINSMKMDGVYGTIASLGNVSSKYSMALKYAAGNRINSVVVSTDAVASKCIQVLKETKSGYATFLPLNKIQDRAVEEDVKKISKLPGSHGLALDLVSYDSKFKSVFKFVFGSTVVVDNVETARKIGIGRARMSTLEGDLIETSGAMTGGYRDKMGLTGFKEKELDSGIERLDGDLSDIVKKIDLIEKHKLDNEEDIAKFRERKASLETEITMIEGKEGGNDVSELRKKKLELEKNRQEHFSLLSEIESDISKADREVSDLRQERTKLQEAIGKLGNNSLSEFLKKHSDDVSNLKQEIYKGDARINSIDKELQLYSGEKEKTSMIIANLEKEAVNFGNEFNLLGQGITELNQQIREKDCMLRQFYSDYDHLFKSKQKTNDRIMALDVNIIKHEERIRSIESRGNDQSIKMAELAAELAGLNKEFEQYANVQLRRGVSVEDLNAEIKNYENMMKSMGSVNLKALEVYDAANTEYGQLVEKYEKLKIEKEQVLNMMAVIDGQKKDIFMKFFRQLGKNFSDIFATLSTKGEAMLVLENPEDIFTGGVDIKVRLAGTRYLDIKSLSGGEKTLTALAFIFAIQEFEPAAFYVLDEPDAALDLKNSELLSKLVSKYSAKAQYIVISHNTSIINDAQNVYGISMQDGISKVVSVKI